MIYDMLFPSCAKNDREQITYLLMWDKKCIKYKIYDNPEYKREQ